jgi:hypothetical protein
MTSKTKVFGGTGYDPYYYEAVSVGSDGKYEIFQGLQRLKWNDYKAHLITQSQIWQPGYSPANSTSLISFDSGLDSPNNPFSSNDVNVVLGRLVSKVKGSEFNLAVSLAELPLAMRMTISTMKALASSLTHAKAGDFSKALNALSKARSTFTASPKAAHKQRWTQKRGKRGSTPSPTLRPSAKSFVKEDIAGRWLELQYGWLPLLGDVYNLWKAIESMTSQRSWRTTATFNKAYKFDSSASRSNYSCWLHGKASYKIIYEATEHLPLSRVLGLHDPLSLVWEILPYSFVVDWFLPIGTYLENLNIIPALRGRFMTIQKAEVRGTTQIFNETYYHGSRSDVYQKIYKRTVSTSLSVPFPGFKKLGDAFGPRRFFSSLALMAQRFI